MPYKHVRIALTLVFAATLAIGAIQVHGVGALLIALAGGTALAMWIAMHRDAVFEAHLNREASAGEYRHENTKARPSSFIAIAILAGCGTAMIVATFAGTSNVRAMLNLVTSGALGAAGATIVCAVLAAFFLATALEFTFGQIWASKRAGARPD